MSGQALSRRKFLSMASVTSGAILLASCAPKTTPAEPTKAGQPAATTQPAPKQTVMVEWLGHGGGDDKWVEDEKVKFRELYPGFDFTIVAQAPGQSRLEQLMALVAAGTPPDGARVESDVYRTFCKYGLLLSCDDYIKADPEMSKPDYWIQPQETDRCAYEGKWYGIGSCWVAPHFFYNADVFKEAGIEPPSNDPEKCWDWPKFLQVAKQLTVDKNGKHPGESGFNVNNVERWGVQWPTWWIPLHAAIQSNGADWVDPKTGKIVIDKPEAIEAFQRIADLMFVHQVMPRSEAMNALGMGSAQLLETKKLGLLCDGSWALSGLSKAKMTLGTGCLPKMKRPGTDMQAHLMCMVKGTKKQEGAWKFLRFQSSPWEQERYLVDGTWLPSQTALMTPEAIKRWCVPPVHPEGYDLIVTQYTVKYGHYLTMPVGYAKANQDVLQPVFDKIWVGQAKPADVLPAAVAQANKVMEAEQARPTA